MRKVITAAIGVCLLFGAGVSAHSDDKERFAESQYRHDNMEIAKNALVNFLQHAQGKANHEGHIAQIANVWALSASMAKASFEKDTRGMEGFTKAKDKIWDNWDDYAKRMDAYAADAAKFAEITAGTDDKRAIMDGFKGVVKHCKSCHDEYRD